MELGHVGKEFLMFKAQKLWLMKSETGLKPSDFLLLWFYSGTGFGLEHA